MIMDLHAAGGSRAVLCLVLAGLYIIRVCSYVRVTVSILSCPILCVYITTYTVGEDVYKWNANKSESNAVSRCLSQKEGKNREKSYALLLLLFISTDKFR